jgi:ABC-type lipoprotein release transport system permease subunit
MRKIALFVKMAARNMIKYGRRSAQSGATVFLGVFFVALAGSFLAGFAFRITQDFITAGGHVVVMAPGYAERREMMPLNRLIQGAEEARVALESAAPGVKAFASLYAPGLVSKGGKPEDAPGDGAVSQEDGSEGVLCVGVMPYAADSVNPAWRSVRGRIASGRFFEGPGDRGMILSDRTASAIGVEPGNTVIFLCSDAFGSFSMIELPLLAVFSADEYSEEFSCIIDLESMQTVTGAEDAAGQIASYAMDGDGLPLEPRSAAVTVRAVETKAVALGLSPERWDAASGTMASMMGFLDAFMLIAYVLFAVVAVVGIMNPEGDRIYRQRRLRDHRRGSASLGRVRELPGCARGRGSFRLLRTPRYSHRPAHEGRLECFPCGAEHAYGSPTAPRVLRGRHHDPGPRGAVSHGHDEKNEHQGGARVRVGTERRLLLTLRHPPCPQGTRNEETTSRPNAA